MVSSSFRASSERREDGSACGFHFLHQRLELFAVAPPGEHGETFGGEFLDDLGADVVAGADHGDGGVTLLHLCCSLRRHCEERSDEAIHVEPRRNGLLRFARNDGGGYFPDAISSTSRNCSLPKNISLPTKKVGEPNAPRSTADCVFSISFAFTSGSCARASSFARIEAGRAQRLGGDFRVVHLLRLAPHVVEGGLDIFLEHAFELRRDRRAHQVQRIDRERTDSRHRA